MGLRRVVGVGQVTLLHSLVDYAVCIAIHRGSQILIVCVYVFFLDVDIATFTVIALRIAGKNYCCPVFFCAMLNLT